MQIKTVAAITILAMLAWAAVPAPHRAAGAQTPAPPSGLIAWYSGTYVQLNWDADPQGQAAVYNVYRAVDSTGGWEKISPPQFALRSFVDSSAPRSALVRYKVTAVGRGGGESAEGAIVEVLTTPAPRGEDKTLVRPAQAFDKNSILTDQQLTDKDAMSLSQIQSFLTSRGSVLANYSTGGRTAAQHIYDACQAHGVSPRVVLTTLQKEKGLVNSPSGNPNSLAMGWNTGDSTTWDFANQINLGTRQFRLYQNNLGGYRDADGVPWAVGQTRRVSDGQITAAHTSTAGLYIYTPWIGGPTGIGGNYLFWDLWYNTYGFASDTPAPDSTGQHRFLTLPFNDPEVKVQQGWIYSFGSDQTYCGHQGLDYIKGTIDNSSTWQEFDVIAAADGEATLRWSDSYGDVVTVKSIVEGVTYYTLYAHLNSAKRKLQLDIPKYVTRGQVIGVAGKTGADSNNVLHLHFELSKQGFGRDSCPGVNACQTCRLDPYGIYGKRNLYPTSADTSCGSAEFYWTQCPPKVSPANTAASSTRWHPDGTLIKLANDNTVWLIENGKRRGVPGVDVFNNHRLGWWAVNTVSQGEFDCYPPDNNLGASPRLLKSNTTGAIYLVRDNSYKSAFTSAAVFEGLGYKWGETLAVPDSEIAQYPDHPTAPQLDSPFPDGTLILKDGTVYVITNGKKLGITSSQAFTKLGYNWGNVISGLSASTVDDITEVLPPITESDIAVCHADAGGGADELGPNLAVTSHTNGQTVTTSAITVLGTASDAGRGDSGVSSVTVNGARAGGDTAIGPGTANWSRTLTLSPGANTLTVVAKDASPGQNSATQTLTINYSTPPPSGVQTLATGLSNPTDLATDGVDVFWTDWGSGDVKKVSVNGGPVTTLFDGPSNTNGIALDAGNVYFGHNGELRKVSKAGGASTLLASGGGHLAVDGDKVFWTGCASGTVQKVSVNGGHVETVASGLNSPSGIAISGGVVYVSEQYHPGAVKKVGTAGGTATTLASGSNTPGIDADASFVYWTENTFVNAGKVRKIPVGGGPETVLASGLDYPYDLARDATRVFWIENRSGGAVKQVHIDGGAPVTLADGLAQPVAVAAAGDYVYWIERADGGANTGTLKRVAKQSALAATVSVSVSAPALNFGDVESGQSSERALTISNDAASTGTLSGNVNASPLPFTVVSGGGPFSLSPGQSRQVVVRFAPTSSVLGTYSLDLTIKHNATNREAPLRVSLSGRSLSPSQPTKVWRVVDTIPLSGTDYARNIAISNGRAYVTKSGGRMTVLDLNSRAEVGSVAFSAFPNASPSVVAVSDGRAYIALSNLGSNGQLAVVDANTLALITYINVGIDPYGVAVHNNRAYVSNNVWWANGDPATVRVVDLSTSSVVATINVGINPQGIAVDPLSGKVFVANSNGLSRSVSVIDTDTNTVTKTVPMPADPKEVAIINDRAYVTTGSEGGRVEEVSTESGLIVTGVAVGREPVGIAGDSGYAFVANQSSNTLSVIDGSSTSVVATLNTGRTPSWVALDPATRTAYVTNQSDNTLTVVRQVTPAYAISGQVTGAAGPMQGVQVALTGAQVGTATTGSDGRYSFAGLPAGGSYAVTPTLAGHSFTPPSISFNLLNADQTANFTGAASEPPTRIDLVAPRAGSTGGGRQVKLTGALAGVSAVSLGGVAATWSYTNGTSEITLTTPAHAAGPVSIDLSLTSGGVYTKPSAFAYLPTSFTDNTLAAFLTQVKAQHIVELRQAVDSLRAVANLPPAQWTEIGLQPSHSAIRAAHILELRTYLDEAAGPLGYPTGGYTDAGLGAGFLIRRVHIEELRQRIRNIAG